MTIFTIAIEKHVFSTMTIPDLGITRKYLGELSYFTNLNSSAIKGDDFPKINHDSQGSVAVRSWSNLPRAMAAMVQHQWRWSENPPETMCASRLCRGPHERSGCRQRKRLMPEPMTRVVPQFVTWFSSLSRLYCRIRYISRKNGAYEPKIIGALPVAKLQYLISR